MTARPTPKRVVSDCLEPSSVGRGNCANPDGCLGEKKKEMVKEE
jgi:hypothetical protein